jgi:hypothetical protein
MDKNVLYEKYEAQWVRIRDVIEGQDAIKDKGTAYLPALSGQTTTEYDAYKYRAVFMNITSRIVNSNTGMITRRTPIVKYPSDMSYLFKDTIGISSFSEIFRYTISEVLQTGRVGLLVDIKNNRPVVLRYATEAILDWYTDDKGILTDVILMSEKVNGFQEDTETSYFHLKLRDGVYSIDSVDDNMEVISNIEPNIKGKTIDFIPITVITPFGIDINPIKSPIIDIVNINISHYLTSADLENGRHFTSLPTPVVTGASTDKPLRIGSDRAWVLPDAKSKAYFLEFLGQGLTSLEKALSEKQSQMSQFSARLMDTSSKGSEAEGTVRLRYAADAATLSDVALSVESGLNIVYKIAAMFSNNDVNDVSIEVNKNFLETKLSYAELKVLSEAFIAGSIDEQTYRYNLQRGEILDPRKDSTSGGDNK